MPNTGKPSLDCHLCRSRRVKCDLGRPACQRCIKYGTQCPGYRDQQELVFRNASPVAAKKRKTRVDQVSKTSGTSLVTLNSPSVSSDSSPSSSRQGSPADPAQAIFGSVMAATDAWKRLFNYGGTATSSDSVQLFRPLNEHWTAQSVPILLNAYHGLNFLQSVYNDSVKDGPLIWAAHLFSRTYVTNLRCPTAVYNDSLPETDRELGTYLGKTLSAVKAALKKPDGPFRNDVMATVWILANYELLIGALGRVESHSPWHLHAQGLYSILKVRGTASLLTESGRTAFWPAYNIVQVNALVCTIECPPESDEWLRVIKDNILTQEGLTLQVAIFIKDVSRIQKRVLDILYARDFIVASNEFEPLSGEMAEAQAELEAYITSHKVGDHFLNPYMHDLRHSAMVKGYHIMHMLANFLTHYPGRGVSLDHLIRYREFCIQTTRSASQMILDRSKEAVFWLGKDKDKTPKGLFDALKLVWPLTTVLIIPTTLPKQKAEAEVALTFIGKEVGVRQALSRYPWTLPLPPEAQGPVTAFGATELNNVGPLDGSCVIPTIR